MSTSQSSLPAALAAGKTTSAPGDLRRLAGPLLALPVTAWLLLAFAAPFVTVLLLSLHEVSDPFGDLLQPPSLEQFRTLFQDTFYLRVVGETLALAAGVTLLSALLGYPLALWLARLPVRWRPLAFAVILIPLLTNVVVRSLGIVLLLAPDGLINQVLGLVGLPPFKGMLYTHGAVAIALAQVFMPFMVLALYDVLQGTSPRVHEAAQSLGASRMTRVLLVDVPLSLPGLRAGIVIVFLLASTAYVSATLLGGKKVFTVGMLVWQEALQNLNAPLASALALVMTATSTLFAVIVFLVVRRFMPWKAGRPAAAIALPRIVLRVLDVVGPILGKLLFCGALLLLLLPLALVCIQSFNDVPQATVAGFRGFTLKWYAAVLFGGAYWGSFVVSVQLAVVSAAVTIALAMPAAFALSRYRFPGLTGLSAFWMLPLSLPHVAIGVGMLRLLQAYTALPPFMGLVAVHVVLSLPFAISLLQASVEQLDKAQEEAAASLGANGLRRFLLVILPGLAPGLAATGIMSFLLSFGEVTVTSFLTTARMTTLPVRIYAESTFSLEPTVHAVSALLIVATVLILLLLNKLVRLDRLYAR
ncbi:ABC transporter permease subunit [uncultured Alsobacter sp.]|uniref:ABC transporter permease subunit n=1 Tax=uncultured Alsobacter sp. TaxID=1748258 RepID=UPI0025DBC4E6|nr:ABC transporter permease subunit [uncultured Alsobacter sp.]